MEDAASRDDTKYSLGSVLNHVLLHQTVIGQEAQKQMEMAGDYPDVVIGCCGGGSNFAGLAFPFLRDKIAGKDIDIVGCEPTACPTLTKGHFPYDFGDTAGMTPLLPMHTLGHTFVPPGIHAGGLRYHGMAPLVSQLLAGQPDRRRGLPPGGVLRRRACCSPAPRASSRRRRRTTPSEGAVNEALKAKEEGEEKTILFLLSGHGHFDMSAYDAYFSKKLEEYELPKAELDKAWQAIKDLPSAA